MAISPFGSISFEIFFSSRTSGTHHLRFILVMMFTPRIAKYASLNHTRARLSSRDVWHTMTRFSGSGEGNAGPTQPTPLRFTSGRLSRLLPATSSVSAIWLHRDLTCHQEQSLNESRALSFSSATLIRSTNGEQNVKQGDGTNLCGFVK